MTNLRSNDPPILDLTNAIIVTAGTRADAVERQAALMLRWEVQRRTGLNWQEATALPAADTPVILVGARQRLPDLPPGLALPAPVMKDGAPAPEGYTLSTDATARPAPTVCAIGNDRRGTLFAVGRLLRALEWSHGSVRLPAAPPISTAPAYPIRGMQLGYRRLNDTVDAWDVGRYAQYVRDLIAFGINGIELIPPVSPGRVGMAELDPLMPLNPWDMTLALCALLDAYDMEVWFWLALESGAAEDADLRRKSLDEREALFAACRRLDHLFVPGGDPGDTPPQVLFPYLDELAQAMRRQHPKARMWVSPQKFRGPDLEYFYEYLKQHEPEWLDGVVWGPGCLHPLPYTRERIPERYPIRHYPDITHAKICQFPFPYWDEVWARAYERQPIQPRPTQFAHICSLLSPLTPGAVAYSDGTGDDVNKIVWGARLWDPQADIREVLKDYGRCFVGPEFADGVADGLLMLERNWVGPAATNPQVAKTLTHWQAMEKRASPAAMHSWRFQQGLIRAYADAYVQRRVQQETALLDKAYAELARAPEVGADAALTKAEKIIAAANPLTAAPALRQRTHELADMLFASIGMQLSIEKHGASALDRGAQLDNNDAALTDCAWLRLELPRIRELPDSQAQLAAIDRIVRWTDPGPGGFYDDMGNRANDADPHLLREVQWDEDPGFLIGIQDSHYGPWFQQSARRSWAYQAHVYRGEVRMRYTGLDPAAAYLLRVTYCGRGKMTLQLHLWSFGHPPVMPKTLPEGVCALNLTADAPSGNTQTPTGGQKVGEPVAFDGRQPVVCEFPVPPSAIEDGALDVMWTNVHGHDIQIAEVWLLKT